MFSTRSVIALITQSDPEPWAEGMLKFLRVALRCRHLYAKEPIPRKRLRILEVLYQKYILIGIQWHEVLSPLPQKRTSRPKRRKGHNLLLRLQSYQSDVLRFLFDPDIL